MLQNVEIWETGFREFQMNPGVVVAAILDSTEIAAGNSVDPSKICKSLIAALKSPFAFIEIPVRIFVSSDLFSFFKIRFKTSLIVL